jgi:hypothetical protein
MAGIGQILDYKSVQSAPRELKLDEMDGCVNVTFPVLPKWVYILPIVSWTMVGLGRLAVGLIEIYFIWKLSHAIKQPTQNSIVFMHRLEMRIALDSAVASLLGLMLAAYLWWKYHRWGRVPRVLTVNNGGLVLSHLGWWRMRERTWPANEFTIIELRMVKGNLNRKRTVADIIIHRSKERRLRYRLSSSDPQLPRRIAERLALVLGCPLA